MKKKTKKHCSKAKTEKELFKQKYLSHLFSGILETVCAYLVVYIACCKSVSCYYDSSFLKGPHTKIWPCCKVLEKQTACCTQMSESYSDQKCTVYHVLVIVNSRI